MVDNDCIIYCDAKNMSAIAKLYDAFKLCTSINVRYAFL